MPNEFSAKRRELRKLGLLILCVFALALAGGSWLIITNKVKADQALERTHTFIGHLDELQGRIQSAHAAQQAYVLSGAEADLADYRAALEAARDDMSQLRTLGSETSVQEERIRKLQSSWATAVTELNAVMDLRQARGLEAARAAVLTGQAVEESLRLIDRLHAAESQQLLSRTAYDAKCTRNLYGLCAGIIAVALGWVAMVLWLLRWIHQLQTGLITVCAWTKQANFRGKWIPLDKYLEDRFGLKVTHGITQEAANEFQAELDRLDATLNATEHRPGSPEA